MKDQKLQRWDTPTRWENPFGLLRRLTGEMERLFEEFPSARSFPRGWRLTDEAHWMPSIDVIEKNGTLMIRADLPGLTKEDVKIEVTDEAITVQGERKKEVEEEGEGRYRLERVHGSFCRVVPLPEGVKPEDVKAVFKNGVLEVTAPLPTMKKQAQPRRVEIQEVAGQKTEKSAA